MNIATINALHTALLPGNLDYADTLAVIRDLCEIVHDYDSESENIWSIDESGLWLYSLDEILIGSFWFCTDYHGGQSSIEYLTYSAISTVYNPGMTAGPEQGTGEAQYYDELVRLHKEDMK